MVFRELDLQEMSKIEAKKRHIDKEVKIGFNVRVGNEALNFEYVQKGIVRFYRIYLRFIHSC